MGVLTAGMGAALAWPTAAPALVAALVLYAAHHALVKGALFLGLGLVERGGLRPWLLAGLGFLALVLAGAPLTSGALAKSVFKTSLPAEAHVLVLLLAVSALATTLLMTRFLFLLWKQRAGNVTQLPLESIMAWLALLAVVAAFPFALSGTGLPPADVAPLALGILLSGIALLAASHLPGRSASRKRRTLARQFAVRTAVAIRRVPLVIQRLVGTLHQAWQGRCQSLQQTLRTRLAQLQRPGGSEDYWPLAGCLWLGIGGLLLATLVLAG
jgi:formate hydrogenlyase subunit 3/multisubunit Na+/H+ antiporter MnhD subunit